MSSESAQMDILRDQLCEANATIDFLRGELWSRAREIWESRDCLYHALVLLALCDSCKVVSLPSLKERFEEMEGPAELLKALTAIDTQTPNY